MEEQSLFDIKLHYEELDDINSSIHIEIKGTFEIYELIYALSTALLQCCYKYDYPVNHCIKGIKEYDKKLRKDMKANE